ncbi:flagellar basal-body MS-ring/collar protein FliF [Pseudomonas abieticivorans]|uniref:flagellar basal-body MS-ring/collar protein FliF n=1 Tax=Pseudomonas abieticivorans TaxID=2931382 RepID=UPI0020BDE28A|nr:flagellar basal-body MS-ring/collar protein FliF [Pseudomonas sp. PIA16]
MSNAAQGKASPKVTPAPAKSNPFEPLLARLRGQPLPLLLGGAAAIALIVALALWAREPEYRVLFSNLSENDGGQIIAELEKRQVPYRLSEGGHAVLVPAAQMNTLRLQLAEQGLPKGGNIGFELMDKQAFGVSQFTEQLNYQRGLEGELARTIESLGPIASARVHLVMARQSVFIREREPARASVLLNLQPGRELGQSQASAIAHLISSSVADLSIDGVTIVDQNGRLLSQSRGDNNGLDGSQLTYVRDVERSYQRRIEDILTPLLGTQNVHAQVVAQVDFSSRESTAERYEPNQDPNQAAVRSKQVNENLAGNDEPAKGVPGALTNTPPNQPAASKATTPAKPADTTTASDSEGQSKTGARALHSERMINYEVDHSVEHVKQNQGEIRRLTSAVVVNYRTVLKDGKPTQEPLTSEELANIDNLVRQAMGFTENRGDQLKVINSPFVAEDTGTVEMPWWRTPEFYSLAMSLSRYLLVAFIALLIWLVLLRPMQRRHAQILKAAEAGEPGDPLAQGVAGSEGQAPRNKAAGYEQNMKRLREISTEDPRLIAMIIRGWMKKDDK